MSTDTPRTDAIVAPFIGQDGASVAECNALLDHARKLERELAAANTRIARLEESGGAMCRQLKDERGTENDWQERAEQAIEDWRKAKL